MSYVSAGGGRGRAHLSKVHLRRQIDRRPTGSAGTFAAHAAPTGPRRSEEEVAASSVACSCGWRGTIADLAPTRQRDMIHGGGFPACPDCDGERGWLTLDHGATPE